MTTVSTRPRFTAKSSARDMRALMRDQQVSASALAWILHASRLRALRLRYWSTTWTVQDVCRLVDACSPASRTVPVWGVLVGAAA